MATRYKAEILRRHYIREWLEFLGVSQAELARRMHTDKANVTRWLDEPWRVNLDVLSGVADALDRHDAGDLLRPPELVRDIEEALAAASRLAETLNPSR
jgi:transcriptional regulator with XRE-family HTH domain